MAGFEQLARDYLRDLLGEVPNDLLPPTHPDGPRSMKALERTRGPKPDAVVVDDPAPEGVCVFRRGCGRSCYCAKAGAAWARQATAPRDIVIRYAPDVVAQLRAKFGPHWPGEPPMLERRRAFLDQTLQDHLHVDTRPRGQTLGDLQQFLQRETPEPEVVRQLLENTGRTAAEIMRNWRT